MSGLMANETGSTKTVGQFSSGATDNAMHTNSFTLSLPRGSPNTTIVQVDGTWEIGIRFVTPPDASLAQSIVVYRIKMSNVTDIEDVGVLAYKDGDAKLTISYQVSYDMFSVAYDPRIELAATDGTLTLCDLKKTDGTVELKVFERKFAPGEFTFGNSQVDLPMSNPVTANLVGPVAAHH